VNINVEVAIKEVFGTGSMLEWCKIRVLEKNADILCEKGLASVKNWNCADGGHSRSLSSDLVAPS